MNTDDAVALIAAAIPPGRGTWVDLGSGDGTFTRALVQLLGPGRRIYAVDRDSRALAKLARWATQEHANVLTVTADFTLPFELPGVGLGTLDGMLLANALHFARDSAAVLGRLVAWLRPGGRLVLVEYDRRAANRWVPYPISAERLPALAAAAGLSIPTITATRPSAFGGILYAAWADRPAESLSAAGTP